MLKEFKNFILKGNVIDLSTGVIIGAAFTTIVTAFTNGIVKPIIQKASGGTDPNITWAPGGFDIGGIINASISFIITAAVVFFIIIKPANKLLAMMKKEEAEAPPAPPAADIALLTEIRDLLKK
jgi:large conductance mechanosensitive channel